MKQQNEQPSLSAKPNWAFFSMLVCAAFATGYVCGQLNLATQQQGHQSAPVVSVASK